LKVEIVLVAHDMRAKFWTREPYRHIQIAVALTNDRNSTVEGMTWELLVPEDAVFDFAGDGWHPSHKHEVDGTAYDVWVDRGGTGQASLVSSGIIFPRGAHVRDKLALNLKAPVTSLRLRWRLFRHEEPMGGFGEQVLTFDA
jgi:hypothetical protein